MCFALLAIGQHTNFPLILAANRDEFYRRPALPMHGWEDEPGVLAGRDIESSGSWLALNQQDARLVLVTNVRDGQPQPGERSRGLLVRDLASRVTPLPLRLYDLPAEDARYAGYNLIAGHLPDCLYYYSNRQAGVPQCLESGFYGLSNAGLDTPWPKLVRGKAAFARLVQGMRGEMEGEALFALLHDTVQAPDELLPDTGVGLERERWLSSVFIHNPMVGYGTRCSTLVWMDKSGSVFCHERRYAMGEFAGESAFEFNSA